VNSMHRHMIIAINFFIGLIPPLIISIETIIF